MGYGGAERLLVDMLAVRDREGFDYEFAYILAAENGLVPAVRTNGVPVHELGASSDFDLRWMAKFRRLLLDGQFDIVHFHLPYTAALGRIVAASIPRSQRPSLMYTEHSLWDRTPTPVRLLNRSTIGLDDALVVVSPAAHDALPSALQAKAQVVVHGVDLSSARALVSRRNDVRREVRAELSVQDDEVLAITVANLRAEKGYDVLLEAARIVAERGLPVRFAAVGRGPLKDELETRHSELGLGDNFKFLGPRGDVLRLLAGSDIFVLPSHHEGMPVTLMEATSIGLAIVATKVGGVPGILTDEESALLVDPGCPDRMADAIARLASQPELRRRLGSAAQVLSTRFDVAAASHQIEDIYRRLGRTA
jgi:glycosyltransferase involved in cell wall biosynthesis